MSEDPRRGGKRVDLRQLVSDGRERAAGTDPDLSESALAPGDAPATGDPALLPGDPRADAPPPVPPEPSPAPSAPQSPERAPAPPAVPPGDPGVALAALYVRVPEHLKDRVEAVAFALRGLRPRPTNQELVAMLIDQQAEPSTPEALATWERHLKRYRRRQAT
jgi:hypothetical protein